MKLQNLTVIFIVIILPIILIVSLYINTGIKTIKYQALYDTALLNATHDAIYAFEQNTANNKYSDNAETKRSIIKSSVKMFETSLANAAGISAYSSDEIEEYIPAIVFGMYDGFYMYAPSYNTQTGKYEHGLKNYVYYSETLDDGTVIRYSLDNYVSVTVKKASGEYEIKEGYLISLGDLQNIDSDVDGKADDVDEVKYKNLTIEKEDIDGDGVPENDEAIKYFKNAYNFSYWFFNEAKIQEKATYLDISSSNDPENDSSAFVQHKKTIIKEKMEGVLNSTITAYSNRTWGQNYKMPKLSEEDWEKIYNNISVTTFFQGKRIGLTKYNGYCVLNSTNSSEYANPNLMYFIADDGDSNTDNYYHDIRCSECQTALKLTGYRIGSFGSKKVTETDGSGNTITKYVYDHDELACYSCINGNTDTSKTIYNYIDGLSDTDIEKIAYWTSLARERYNTIKLTTLSIDDSIDISFNINDGPAVDVSVYNDTYSYGDSVDFPSNTIFDGSGYEFIGWNTDSTATTGILSPTDIKATSDTTYYAIWKKYTVTYLDKVWGTEISSVSQMIGEKVTISSVFPSEYPGGDSYTLGGNCWVRHVGGAREYYNAGEEYLINEDVTLFPNWIASEFVRVVYYVDSVRTDGYVHHPVKGHDIKILSPDELVDKNSRFALRESGYFVGWKEENGTEYYPGDIIENIGADVTLYPIMVEMPELAIVNGSNNVINFVNDTFTNEETVKFLLDCDEEDKPYIEFFVNGVPYSDGEFKKTTGSDEVRGYEINYYFQIKNVNGNAVKTSTPQILNIVVDRKAPDIKWTISDGKVYARITDDSGIDGNVEIKYKLGITVTKNMTNGTYTIDGEQYNYCYDMTGLAAIGTRTITVTDKAGNSVTVTIT